MKIIYDSDSFINNVKEKISKEKNANINIVNDKLTISVFENLRKNIKNIDNINLIIRSALYNSNSDISREFEITKQIDDILFNSYDIVQKNKLTHLNSAKKMYEFINEYVNVKKIKNSNIIKSNLLTVGNEYGIIGDSSLEVVKRKTKSFNFNTEFTDIEQIKEINDKFDLLWNSTHYTEEYKKELLEKLKFIYKDYSPEFLYFFTLFNIFGNNPDEDLEKFENDKISFKQTEVWNKLYKFQKDGVVSAINKIEKYNGCIIADSVGLGKTFEALAVIKYYEMKNNKVLVLTPKKLYENWSTYKNDYIDNPIAKDRLHYDIMYHSDLSRKKGKTVEGKDLERMNLGNYELLVIDESHNFRNRVTSNERETRYTKLINEIIKKGYRTKVLLLSATPVNNSLVDLKNQLSIITVDDDKAFTSEKIPSVAGLLKTTQQVTNEWSKEEEKDKQELLNRMPANFFKLLENITISRSRKHITSYYGTSEVGSFPKKELPMTVRNKIDIQDEILKFKDINEMLDEISLAVYSPMAYILPEHRAYYREVFQLNVKDGQSTFYQEDREKSLNILYKFNVLKRMESSVASLGLTLSRLEEQIEKLINDLNGNAKTINVEKTELSMENEEDIINVDETSIEDIKLEHLDKELYLYDLNKDKKCLNRILEQINNVISNDRDEKLLKLKDIIEDKILNTPYNSGNKKILIFSAFADTVKYLYKELSVELKEKYNINSALITGSDTPKTTDKKIANKFNTVLSHFSPISKHREIDNEIEILFATDCISEGQNLQDCDCVINYDIHWNPVRIIQRFGRVDRIGSKNNTIKMINFFPDMELNEYLNLERRVKGKMILTNMTSTGDEDQLSPEMNDFNFRQKQLEKLQNQVMDLEDANDSISLTDLNLNDYKYDIKQYLNNNPDIRKVPKGIYSIVTSGKKGAIFCFKKNEEVLTKKEETSIYPYYVVYVSDTGEIYYDVKQVREVLKIYRELCYGNDEPIKELIKTFNKKTNEGENMKVYSELLNKAIENINGDIKENEMHSMFSFDGLIASEDDTEEDFELISMLIIE